MKLPWTRLERRWRDALCAAMIPARPDALDGADDPFWDEYAAASPALLRLGLRASVWALSLSPPLLLGKLATFERLSPDERDELLGRVAGSRFYAVRQLALVLKLTACFAHLRDDGVRARVEGQP